MTCLSRVHSCAFIQALVAVLGLLLTLQATAQEIPLAAVVRGGGSPIAHGAEALTAVDECPSNDVCYDLSIRYTTGRLRNPSFAESDPGGYDLVKLRSYVGTVVDGNGARISQTEFVAPQVELKPGDTYRLNLHNDLAKAEDMGLPWLPEPCSSVVEDHNTPDCANSNLTNMHFHGGFVSPSGNSDNVLLTLHPGVSFTYEYNIPEDHPAGTFWYHSHKHGSTALQVASGMAGTIIIRGDRQPQLVNLDWTRPGDIDLLLPPIDRPDITDEGSVRERVMLFQQIAYACRDPDGTIKRTAPNGPWLCDTAQPGTDPLGTSGTTETIGDIDIGRVGTVEPGPGNAVFDLLGNAWGASGRHTAINGVIHKQFSAATTGTLERWRLIDAGIRQTIRLQVRKAVSPAAANELLRRAEAVAAEDVLTVCGGAPLEVVGLAADGLTRPHLDLRTDTWLQPGYREDILVSFPEEGTYCLVNAAVAGTDNVSATEGQPGILGLVSVTGPASSGTVWERVVGALVATAQDSDVIENPAARTRIVADLQTGGLLSAFVPHRTVLEADLTGEQTLGIEIGGGQFAIGTLATDDPVNFYRLDGSAEYDPNDIPRLLPLGGVEEWKLTSFVGGHPFHIHVNAFEIVDIRKYLPDPNVPAHANINPLDEATWVDVSGPGASEEYAGLKGVWKDTVFLKQGYLVRFRTRYERYIGDFVLHCHILDHEDQGMMQNVRIALTDGRDGFDGHGH